MEWGEEREEPRGEKNNGKGRLVELMREERLVGANEGGEISGANEGGEISES